MPDRFAHYSAYPRAAAPPDTNLSGEGQDVRAEEDGSVRDEAEELDELDLDESVMEEKDLDEGEYAMSEAEEVQDDDEEIEEVEDDHDDEGGIESGEGSASESTMAKQRSLAKKKESVAKVRVGLAAGDVADGNLAASAEGADGAPVGKQDSETEEGLDGDQPAGAEATPRGSLALIEQYSSGDESDAGANAQPPMNHNMSWPQWLAYASAYGYSPWQSYWGQHYSGYSAAQSAYSQQQYAYGPSTTASAPAHMSTTAVPAQAPTDVPTDVKPEPTTNSTGGDVPRPREAGVDSATASEPRDTSAPQAAACESQATCSCAPETIVDMTADGNQEGGKAAAARGVQGRPLDDGCTLALNILVDGWLVNCNVGDSRTCLAYRPAQSFSWSTIFASEDHSLAHADLAHHIVESGGEFIDETTGRPKVVRVCVLVLSACILPLCFCMGCIFIIPSVVLLCVSMNVITGFYRNSLQ